jgi:hypothetical protein
VMMSNKLKLSFMMMILGSQMRTSLSNSLMQILMNYLMVPILELELQLLMMISQARYAFLRQLISKL